jgi:predicted phosphatase
MQSVIKVDTQKHPFMDYSATHWISHVKEARISSTQWISRTAKLCDIKDGLSCTWFNIYSRSHYRSSPRKKRIALHWGVLLGLVNETRYLLESSSDCHGSEFSTQDIFVDAMKNQNEGRELIDVFLHMRGDEVKVTEQVAEIAAQDRESGKEIMALLLDRRVDGFDMLPETVAAVAQLFDEKAIASLLDQRGCQVKITAQVVEAAAKNKKSGKEIMTLLLDQRVDGFNMSPETVAAVARSFNKRAIASLLDQRGDEVKITAQVVEAAASNRENGEDIMALLLDRRATRTQLQRLLVSGLGISEQLRPSLFRITFLGSWMYLRF